jgi:hypothetical protein
VLAVNSAFYRRIKYCILLPNRDSEFETNDLFKIRNNCAMLATPIVSYHGFERLNESILQDPKIIRG